MNKPTILGNILTTALGLWLKSQAECIEALHIEVAGGDLQLLKGDIPRVLITCRRAVYRGLHLRQIQLKSENIRLSLGQILNGYPLSLLEPVPVIAKVVLEESDLQASLASPLLNVALTDLFLALLDTNATLLPKLVDSTCLQNLKPTQIRWQGATLTSRELSLTGTLIHLPDPVSFRLRAGVAIANHHALCLQPLHLEIVPGKRFELNAFPLDLGSDVELEAVTLTAGKLTCSGKLVVVPHSN